MTEKTRRALIGRRRCREEEPRRPSVPDIDEQLARCHSSLHTSFHPSFISHSSSLKNGTTLIGRMFSAPGSRIFEQFNTRRIKLVSRGQGSKVRHVVRGLLHCTKRSRPLMHHRRKNEASSSTPQKKKCHHLGQNTES